MNDIEIFFFNLRDFEWTLKTQKRSKVNDFIPKKNLLKGIPDTSVLSVETPGSEFQQNHIPRFVLSAYE